MKPNPPRFLLRGGALTASLTLLAVLAAAPVEAATRTSASYSIATDSIDAGGRASGSANYSQNGGSLGAVAGVANNGAALPSEVAKTGYLGQLYEIIGFAVTAPTSGVNENATLQLGGAQVLDDLTLLPVPASAVTWSVASGPLSSISSAGLATAGHRLPEHRGDRARRLQRTDRHAEPRRPQREPGRLRLLRRRRH